MRHYPWFLGVLCLGLVACSSQQDSSTASPFVPQGEFRLLPFDTMRRNVDQLLSGDDATFNRVVADPNQVTPPVLFALAWVYNQKGDTDNALFWLYTAQLRARSDANKCLDTSTQAAVTKLTAQFGQEISAYGLSHPDQMEWAMRRVLQWDKRTVRHYNPRWVALMGDEAKERQDYAFLPMDKWSAIDQMTHRDFARGFAQMMVKMRRQQSGAALTD